MQRKIKFLGKRHFENNFIIYFILFIFLISGIIIGSILVNRLDVLENYNIIRHFNPLMDYANKGNQFSLDIFKIRLLSNIKFGFIIWLSGLIFIGIITIPLIIFLKGINIGFTVGFLVKKFGIKGFTFAFFGLLPHYLILLPGILAICSIGLSSSKSNINLNRNSMGRMNKMNLVEYSLLFLFFFMIVMMGYLVEAFITPYFIKLTKLNL